MKSKSISLAAKARPRSQHRIRMKHLSSRRYQITISKFMRRTIERMMRMTKRTWMVSMRVITMRSRKARALLRTRPMFKIKQGALRPKQLLKLSKKSQRDKLNF
jgi:hypothetical protein